MRPGNIEALCFDVFGTVVDWRSGVAREAEVLLAPRGVSLDWPAFAGAWRARYQPAMEEVRAGRRGFVKLDVLHRENLEVVLAEHGLTDLSEATVAELNLAWRRLDPWPDVVDGLTRLKGCHILAPVSNGNLRLMVDLARRGGLPWDAILGAEVARAYKPAPEACLRSAALLDLPPAACVMVAAHNDDLAAAQEQGLQTAFVIRPREHGPGQTRDLEPEADWDFVARDFGELATRLGC